MTNLFNGLVYVKKSVKSGGLYELTLVFKDLSSQFRGIDAQIGDVVYCRAPDGKGQRLEIKAIALKVSSQIICTVQPQNAFPYIPTQWCALVRETENHQYPQFPVGLPLAIRGIMESYFAWKVDFLSGNTEVSCSGNLITAAQVKGSETVCLNNEDGTKTKITLLELRKYMHIFKAPDGEQHEFKVTNEGQLIGRPPQY